ncbi:MAG: carboxy terminal-processing peptidase [Terrimicrobiaceae bacterium]|nr:carboxy terminal-processing peptidase [Terrimicrobiaceae bacterium]
MNFRSLLSASAAALILVSAAPRGNANADASQVAIAVGRWLEQAHYTRQKLDDEMSSRLLNTYLENLDYNRLYFTQADIDEFTKKYGSSLDDAILRGDLEPAREIFARFKSNLESRVESAKKLAKRDYAFDSDRTVELNRSKAPWPKDAAEADRLWQERIEAELLQENLNEFRLRPPAEAVSRRYEQALRNVREMDDQDVVKNFLNALAQSYDPHSEYLSPSDMENFNIAMRLSLVGVGAVLRSDEGYARVMEVVPGGPADRDGRLKVNDRIAAVAQGEDEFEDVVDMKLDKVVERIRGKKGSIVRLQIIPADAADPSKRRIIEITRDEVKLKDQEAKAEVLDLQDDKGKTTRIGWITLPSFYANMSGGGPAKSTTEDVAALIGRLKQEAVEGLVIDLRKDGGGSLEEAINLTGLFIPKGPVVQSKDPNGKVTVSSDTNPGVAYSGPLVVVMNRLSASASEIFAAALQDYGRAVIVGDERSFGKGTVQTVLDIGRVMPFFSLGAADAGALKLTIQKFYRVRGGSTQLKGVESDIVLPSRTDNSEIGEGSLRNRLEYDEVAPVKISESAAQPLFLDELRRRSTERLAADPEFLYVSEDMARLRDRIASNKLSLNKKERQQELADDKARRELRKKERTARGPLVNVQAWQLTLDDVRSRREKLEAVAYEREREKRYVDPDDPESAKEDDTPEPDPIRNESLRIAADLIQLNAQAKTAARSPQ